jgi:hypothetical protein
MEFVDFFESTKVLATILHVISVIFGMGSALISDILFTFFSRDRKLNKTEISTLSILSKVVLISLFLIILSGLAIFLSDIDKYLSSAKFLAKMTIMIVLLVNGYILNNYIWDNLLKKDFLISNKRRNVRRLAFIAGAVSVISWLFVCILGIVSSSNLLYSQIIFLYISLVIISSVTSIFIENKNY